MLSPKIHNGLVLLIAGLLFGGIIGFLLGARTDNLLDSFVTFAGSVVGVMGAFGAVWFSQYLQTKNTIRHTAQIARGPIKNAGQAIRFAMYHLKEAIDSQGGAVSKTSFRGAALQDIDEAIRSLEQAVQFTQPVPTIHTELLQHIEVITVARVYIAEPAYSYKTCAKMLSISEHQIWGTLTRLLEQAGLKDMNEIDS